MIISDLNYLESADVTVEGGISNRFSVTKLAFLETVLVEKVIVSVGVAKGNVAFAEADADALGNDTLAQALSTSYTTPISSSASATSISVTG
ncbi:MAG: hypothetical protein AAGF93_07120 [Cyanobacteria bacterium P01_H01_bin.105]